MVLHQPGERQCGQCVAARLTLLAWSVSALCSRIFSVTSCPGIVVVL